MKKSVYSLVLMDEVVEAIDQLAYSMNTSRSNLINQILAERVSLMTPEMRMRQIFDRIGQLMDSRFQLLAQPSDAMISIRSPLKYRYKPTIKYSVELYRSFQGAVGRLRVSFRTQSVQFIAALQGFFSLWASLEKKYLDKLFEGGVPAEYTEISFSRDFYSISQNALSDTEIAEAIGAYIDLTDRCIKLYFEDPGSEEKIEEQYCEYLKKGYKIV